MPHTHTELCRFCSCSSWREEHLLPWALRQKRPSPIGAPTMTLRQILGMAASCDHLAEYFIPSPPLPSKYVGTASLLNRQPPGSPRRRQVPSQRKMAAGLGESSLLRPAKQAFLLSDTWRHQEKALGSSPPAIPVTPAFPTQL